MLEKEKEMSMSCDGLISRFLIAAPKPIRQELTSEINTTDGLKLNHLIYGIYTINKNFIKILDNSIEENIMLKFDESSFAALNKKFREYDATAQKFEIVNPFIWFDISFFYFSNV